MTVYGTDSYNSRENLFLRRNINHFDYIGWTWNIYQEASYTQANIESKAWTKTKRAHKPKQMCWQDCSLCWKDRNIVGYLKWGASGKFEKKFFLQNDRYLNFVAEVSFAINPLQLIFNRTIELCRSFETRTAKTKWTMIRTSSEVRVMESFSQRGLTKHVQISN